MEQNFPYSFESSLSLALNQIMVGVISYIPSLLGALVLFLIGILVAGWIKSLVVKLVNVTKIGNLISNPAVKSFLKNAQVTEKIEVVIGEVARWLVLILFFVASVNVLGLTPVSMFLNSIIAGIPTVIAAVIILLVGIFVSGFLEKMIKGSLGAKDPSFSRLVGKVASYASMTFFVLAAISQLGIARFFIETAYTGLVAALALAIGLSLGLGSKDLIKKFLEDWYNKSKD